MSHVILVIAESKLIRDYLSRKLGDYGFRVATAQNGFEGGLKLRGGAPDLVIMDYELSRITSVQLLEQKMQNPNFRDVPVIMVAAGLTRERLLELARFRIRRFLAKPLKVDAMVKAVSEVLGVALEIDSTPCILDAHFNDGILFIEVARGLNSEKIDLLPYKIKEVLEVYGVATPKVLIMMTDIRMAQGDETKLHGLLAAIRMGTGTPWKGMRLLTTSDEVKNILSGASEYEGLEAAEDVTRAMDGLLGIKVSDFIEEGMTTVKQDLLQAGKPAGREAADDSGISIRMEIDNEQGPEDAGAAGRFADVTVAVADDDEVIRSLVRTTFSKLGCAVREYENGRRFLDDLVEPPPSILFLDLMMPETDGFAVLASLRERKIDLPIVVLSALTEKETVVRVAKAGVKSYMIKPIKPEQILQKTFEILRANF